jgi:hypothetical protein
MEHKGERKWTLYSTRSVLQKGFGEFKILTMQGRTLDGLRKKMSKLLRAIETLVTWLASSITLFRTLLETK